MEKFSLFFFGLWWEGGHNDAECSMEVLDLSPCGRWDVGGENDAWMKKGKHPEHMFIIQIQTQYLQNKDFSDIQYSLNNKGNYRALI